MEIDGVITELNTKLRNFKQAWAAEFTTRLQAKYYPGHGEITGDLKRGWGATFKSTSIEWYNTQEYASFVEYGVGPHTRTSAWGRPTAPYIHPGMAPQGQLRTTIAEHDQISEVAAKQVGLK